MTQEQKVKCHKIIHSSATASAAVGALGAQLPMSDSMAIVPIQITMIVNLGTVFGTKLSESAAASTLATSTATLVGRGMSQWLIGFIPVIGNVFNAGTAFAITETIGWAVAFEFAKKKKWH